MRTNDQVFIKEFKDMMNTRKRMVTNFNVAALPLPSFASMSTGMPKKKKAVVRKIKEPFFERLNNEEVFLIGRTSLKKRQVLSDGSFRKDDKGRDVTIPVPVPRGSVAILSSKSIGLRRKTDDGRVHKVSEGFMYVDYNDTQAGRRYIYIVPKEYVFRLNMCSLVITPNKRRTFFKGYRLALRNGNYIYLYVIPLTYREHMDMSVLGVKSSFQFDAEVHQLVLHWMKLGVLFNLRVTALENQINGVTNLGYTELDGTIVEDDFVRYDKSLAEEASDDLDEY